MVHYLRTACHGASIGLRAQRGAWQQGRVLLYRKHVQPLHTLHVHGLKGFKLHAT